MYIVFMPDIVFNLLGHHSYSLLYLANIYHFYQKKNHLLFPMTDISRVFNEGRLTVCGLISRPIYIGVYIYRKRTRKANKQPFVR